MAPSPHTDLGSERRRFRRVPFQAPARLRQGERTWDTRLVDLSLRGALVLRPHRWNGDIGQHLDLEIDIDGESITLGTAVAHQRDNRIGLRCEHIDGEDADRLRDLVEEDLGDPSLADRDLSSLS